MIYFQTLAGLVMLVLGGDLVVRGAVAVAHRFRVKPVLVGLTVISFGTSLPELLVSVEAVTFGYPGLAVGSIVGSNIANILLILGVTAVIYPIALHAHGVRREAGAVVGSALLLFVLGWGDVIVAWHGAAMLALLAGLTWSTYRRNRLSDSDEPPVLGEAAPASRTGWATVGFIAGGLVFLMVGADQLIEGGVAVAHQLGVPNAIIGLTLIGIGSSLPELTSCAIAAYRRQPGLAVGNVLGSNVFNILGALGAAALVGPIPVDLPVLEVDIWIMLAASVAVALFVFTGRPIGRLVGASFLAIFAVYITAQFIGV
jgi:cation:H+ antiporter